MAKNGVEARVRVHEHVEVQPVAVELGELSLAPSLADEALALRQQLDALHTRIAAAAKWQPDHPHCQHCIELARDAVIRLITGA